MAMIRFNLDQFENERTEIQVPEPTPLKRKVIMESNSYEKELQRLQKNMESTEEEFKNYMNSSLGKFDPDEFKIITDKRMRSIDDYMQFIGTHERKWD